MILLCKESRVVRFMEKEYEVIVFSDSFQDSWGETVFLVCISIWEVEKVLGGMEMTVAQECECVQDYKVEHLKSI